MDHLLADGKEINNKYVGEIAGRIKTLREIVDLPFEAIENFYQKEEENETETYETGAV